MHEEEKNPLCKSWIHLLEIAANAPDLRDCTLAALAGLKESTVHEYFQRMFEATGIHERGQLLFHAMRKGWINPPPRMNEGGRLYTGTLTDRLLLGRVVIVT